MQGESILLSVVESALGPPYCRGEVYGIWQADCLSAMRALPAEMVNLTITSPPYNIGKEYEKPLPLDQYLDWCGQWLAEIYRLTKLDGAFWLNLGYVGFPGKAKAVPLPYLLWDRSPFALVQEVVWNYGAGVAAKRFLSPRNEKFLWYVKDLSRYTFNLDDIRDPDVKYPKQKKNGRLRCNTVGKNPSDVWQIAKVTSGENRSSSERAPHPAQFPLDLVTRLVKGFSNPGGAILDPFMGSGTTAEACLRHGREVIGFEINPEYCQYIARRLRKVNEDRKSFLFEV